MASKVVFESKKKPITHATQDDSLMTIYDLEFTKKFTPRTKPYCPPELMPELGTDKPDPISEAFRQELLPDYERKLKPDGENYEGGDAYFNRLKERKPSIVKVVEEEVNQDVLKADYELYDGRTVYQAEYCKISKFECLNLKFHIMEWDGSPSDWEDSEDEDDFMFHALHRMPWHDYCSEKTVGMRPLPVPDAWKPIPLTLYRLNYRDHNKMATWKIVPEPAKCPPSYFDPNPQERELLKVSTGVSEYAGVIGRLGTEVINKEYHGHITPLPGEYIPIQDVKSTPAPPPTPNSNK